MSGFLSTEINNLLNLNTTTENLTVSNLKVKSNNTFSATSSNLQIGGSFSTSNKVSNSEINNLISMLTSESSIKNNNSITNTEQLENKLRNLLGSKQNGGANTDTNLPDILTESDVNPQYGGAIGPFIAGAVAGVVGTEMYHKYKNEHQTETSEGITTIINKGLKTGENKLKAIYETTTDKRSSDNLSQTSDFDGNNTDIQRLLNKNKQVGGKRELSPSMYAFQDICKLVSKKLEIPNGPKTKKISGQIQRDIKEKQPVITPDELINAVKELLNNDSKVAHYKKMI
jgi:hypothetical protein